MKSDIVISEHYTDRFRKRIARTKRIKKFANDAYTLGKGAEKVDDKRLQRYIENKENGHINTTLRVYKGFIHVFGTFTPTAITVYRIPNEYR